MAVVLRAPVVSSYPGKKGQPAEILPNLLLSTFALVAAAPLRPALAEQSRPRALQTQDTSAPNALLATLPPAQSLPIGENDLNEWTWPRLLQRPQDTASPQPFVLTLPPAQSLPVGQNDLNEWTWPRVRISAQQTAGQAQPLTLALPTGQPPLAAIDLTPALARARGAQADAPPIPLALREIPAQLLPVGQNDLNEWTWPRTYAHHQDTSVLDNLILQLPPAQVVNPLAPVDLTPNLAPKRPQTQDTGQQNLLVRLLAPIPLPFVQTQDFSPAGPRARGGQADAPAFNLVLGTGQQPGVPLSAVDLTPTLVKARGAQDTNSQQLMIYQTVFPPVAAIDVAGQRAPRPGAQAEAIVNRLVLLAAAPLPFVQLQDLAQAPARRGFQADAISAWSPPASAAPPLLAFDLTAALRMRLVPQDTEQANRTLFAPQPQPIVAVEYQAIQWRTHVAQAPFDAPNALWLGLPPKPPPVTAQYETLVLSYDLVSISVSFDLAPITIAE